MEPLVSIILTSYNHEKHIGKAIESVLNQTYTNFELFIVDDCSDDKSWDIINTYNDSRIVAIRNKVNMRIEGWSSVVLNKAKGKYVAMHHSDDLWQPEKLQKQVDFLENNSAYGASFTLVDIIDDEGNIIDDERNNYTKGIFDQPNRNRYQWLNFFFYKSNALCHPSLLIKRESYQEYELIEYGMGQLPDFNMWVKLCLHTEIYVIQERLTQFRVLKGEKNSSGARPEVFVRTSIELYRILSLFVQIVNSEIMIKIFPETERFCINGEMVVDYAFAQLCIEHSSNIYKLFGLQLMFELINDNAKAAKIFSLYGYNHIRYIEDSGKYDLFNVCDGAYISNKLKLSGNVFYRYEEDYLPENNIPCKGVYQNGIFKYRIEIPPDLKTEKKIIGLRFDPIEGMPCEIRILEVNSDGNIENLVPATTNIKNGNYDAFISIDPIYDIRGEVDKISYIEIFLEIKGVGLRKALEDLNLYLNKIKYERQEIFNQFKEEQSALAEKQIQLKEKQTQLQISKDKVEEMSQKLLEIGKTERELRIHIANMEESLSWKVTKPLRVIKKYLTKE